MIFYRYATILLLLINVFITAYLYRLYIGLSSVVFYQSLMLKNVIINYDIFFAKFYTQDYVLNLFNTINTSFFFRERGIIPISEWRFQNSIQYFDGVNVKNEWLVTLDNVLTGSKFDFLKTHETFRFIYIYLEEFLIGWGIELISPFTFLLFFVAIFLFFLCWVLVYSDFGLNIVSSHHIRLQQLELFVAEKLNNGKPILFRGSKSWNPVKDLKNNDAEFYSDKTIADWLEEAEEAKNKKNAEKDSSNV